MLAATASVDAVVKEKGDPDWRLVLEVELGEWALQRALPLLEDKLNAYASFALDGMMQKLYPHSRPELTRIVVASVEPMPERAVWLLEKVRIALRAHRMRIDWDAAGGAPEGGTPPPPGMGTGA